MKINAQWTGGMAYDSKGDASGYQVTMDASSSVGGNDGGPRPMEMLLHGVAGCMGIDLNVIMRHSMDKVESIEIEIDGERAETEPKRFTHVDVIVKIKGDVSEKVAQRAVELSAEKYCSAINSLNAAVEAKLELNGELK
ncbi:OsmC family protein [Salinicoccus sp. ID82-1]|uniref:OsmC family protein n=1 Tax=Salinicoccus cyprini TaxID=2493691 RepID=A0A558ASU6_9STAP|nr:MULTISPECIES: OsmC family protein [Salinicoccus]MCG1009871.1 OsmC family protein [Salinicoccus sp. ID82-1]TVT27266.1 OsmC family protein [Salinicoccus cyprini]